MEPVKSTVPLTKGVLSHTSVSPTKDLKEKATSSDFPLILSGNGRTTNNTIENQEMAIEELNKAINAIQGPQRSLEFSIHKETHAVMIKVMNKETGELIREVPPEKILDVAAKMMEFAGLMVDKKI
ncbi:flagellar protein FlaG [Paenibacillus pabuli]|uniref:flagellar protein FlaG n=1 Tax=Paenibacillus pabuli TaxID=1472 RepID=UPI000783A814|nr:flagellar protein FlaG [Paenibacillus pabuli]MEC0129081.1 flagellar protein FlaG [Paenibacillus pabuli]